ncbi:MAG: Stp1/IreP family PP2C-type Ser/Thr phosphatase [Deltaproteobacteria bacterium]|nr:Stp1/IreP family PP2C-type Ser/Thr phosphatase [Deltaproteobacteria bacterium]
MASGSRARPSSFPPGSNVSDYYRVEGLVRLSEGRMFYLVNDHRPDRAHRRCWECGHEENRQSYGNCESCGASLAVRRFLLSSRWDRNAFEAYTTFFQRQIAHPAFLSPCDVFPWPDDHPNQLCSVVPYNGETFLLDEAAPLPLAKVVRFAQRACGMLGMLSFNGVRLGWLNRSNFLLRPSGEIMLFDPEVASVTDGPLGPEDTRAVVMQLGEILRRYTPLEEREWQQFYLEAERGAFSSAAEFGRALQIEANHQRANTSTRHAGMTDVGLQRALNEDNWGWARLGAGVELFVVADGMGGHDCGEVASRLAVETLIQVARQRIDVTPRPGVDEIETILDQAFQAANNTIKGNAEARGNDMGTTLVACMVIDDSVALCANVGDSRGYLIRNGTLHQVTRDHSLVARMVEQNRLTADEARNHPHSNILLRTVGTERNVDIDIFRVDLEPNDRILLCSDGLWGEVEDEEMEQVLGQHEDNRSAARELVRAAHLGGGKDNISVVIASVPGVVDESPASLRLAAPAQQNGRALTSSG